MTLTTTEKKSAAKLRVTMLANTSEIRMSRAPNEVIGTGPLGSCVGLSLYDPEAKLGGVMICMLPDSSVDPETARLHPGLFADTGVSTMLDQLREMGGQPERCLAKVAGAGTPLGNEQTFCLGPRNLEAVRQALRANGVAIQSEETGGPNQRNMTLRLADGETRVISDGEEVEL